MNDKLKKEILSLLESPELREYLMALPENCSFMKQLSEKIHANPGYGDQIDEVLCDLKL